MIDVGVIGIGYWGLNYIRIFNELLDSQVTWCSDIDADKLKSVKDRYPPVKTATKYTEILKDPDIDTVCISTPASTHYKIIRESLSQGKHVLTEKPMALSSKEARELVDLSKKYKKTLMVGHTFIYNSTVQKLKELISKGELGDIYYIHFSRTGLGPIRNDVNVMWDLAPHDISILRYLLDADPSEVSAVGQAYLQEGIEDVVFVTLKFPNNVLANIHTSWLDPYKVREATVVGSKKMGVFDDVENLERLKIFDKGVLSQAPETYGEFRFTLREGDILIPKVETSEPLKNQCLHFLDCIKSKKTPQTDGTEGLKVVKILEAAQKSLENQGVPERVVM